MTIAVSATAGIAITKDGRMNSAAILAEIRSSRNENLSTVFLLIYSLIHLLIVK
jgi:hypothetical protein